MPPWRAVPGYGPKFQHDRSLPPQDIATLVAWADAGAPEGNLADLPPPPKFSEGWTLGAPDVEIVMPEPFEIPASGGDIYRCFVIPNPLSEDAQVIGIEFRPGNPRVVHHIAGYIDTTGEARKKDEAEPGQGYTCFGVPQIKIRGDLSGWAPGANPAFLSERAGRILPKGSDIVLQVHYHPDGKPETDISRIGLYLAPKDKPIKKAFTWMAAANQDFRIPPGESNYEVVGASVPMPVDVQILAVSPHMHRIGRDMEVWAELPDKTRKDLIHIDPWDFNWQLQYYLERPLDLPKGSVVKVRAHYDSSKLTDPVKYGEATTDEMCFGFFGIVKKNQDLTRPGEKDDLRDLLEQEYKKVRQKGEKAPSPVTPTFTRSSDTNFYGSRSPV